MNLDYISFSLLVWVIAIVIFWILTYLKVAGIQLTIRKTIVSFTVALLTTFFLMWINNHYA